MNSPRQTSRSMAVLCVLAALLGSASACSSLEDGAAGDESFETYNTGGDESNETSGSEGDGDGDEGTDETGEEDPDEGMPEAGPEDPDLDLGACDPSAPQVIAYGLEHANAEAAPALVRASVLGEYGDAVEVSVPAIPLSARPFLNAFEFGYEPAEPGVLALEGELWKSAMLNVDAPPRYRLQYAVRGPALEPAQRDNVDLAVVVDLGAGMAGDPYELALEALAALDSALRPGDRVSLIAAGAEPALLGSVLVEGPGEAPATSLFEIEGVQADGVGKVKDALELAYATIAEPWEGQGQARVLLLSNGGFELDEELAELVEDHAEDGHYLLSVGLGDPKLYDAATMDVLARDGRGASLFAATAEELWQAIDLGFSAHFIAAASEVEVTLTLPAGLAVRQREPYVGAAGEPKLAMLTPNDALVFHHELEACGALEPDAVIRVELEWHDPIADEAKQAVWEQPVIELDEPSLLGLKGAAVVAYARALRAIRDGQGPAQSHGAVLDAISLISDALEALPEDADLIEMSAVIAGLL